MASKAREAFFQRFYEWSERNTATLVPILGVGQELGLSHEETTRIARGLAHEGLIVYKAEEALYSLTPEGLARAEKAQEGTPGNLVFLCYSRQDKRWLERLRVHLASRVREGILDVWDDQRIQAGSEWRQEIHAAIQSARAAVLLISADFFASDFIASDELPPLLEAAKRGETRILPLILGPSSYERSALAKIQTFNSLSKPLSAMEVAGSEKVLADLAAAIEELISPPRSPF